MSNAEYYDSIYAYDDDEDDEETEPYLYSPREPDYDEETYDDNDEDDYSLPEPVTHQNYNDATQVPFYGTTTNGSEYTWKVPVGREKRSGNNSAVNDDNNAQKIPFYSETTHRSEFVPIDASVRRTRLSQRNQVTPTQNIPIQMETTYRTLYPAQNIGKREKSVHTCPAEKIMHQRSLLMKANPRNGHYFLPCQDSSTSGPTLLKELETNNDNKLQQ